MGEYRLRCLEGSEYVDESYTLKCDEHPGLLRAEYTAKRLSPTADDNVFKFYDWLPVRSKIESRAKPVVFQNPGLNKELGIDDLWIGFTGYYPERNAFVTSCSFKEMEALPTIARLNDMDAGKVVVASAGNTGRAFAQVSNEADRECIVIVPSTSGDRIRVSEDKGKARLITVKGDYADAIALSERISAFEGFVPEGGAKNIARRDGMGTVMLEAALTMDTIPDNYFQAIGSGTGGISAWEASMRLIGDGRFGDKLPKLHLSQNSPFTPMKNAWDAGRRKIVESDMVGAKEVIAQVYADVLTNRSPPYGVVGGVFDAMSACGGRMYSVTNKQAKDAESMWNEHENAALDPAAAVALASLISHASEIKGSVLLNVTGGGHDRVTEDIDMISIKPYAEVDMDISDDELRRLANE